MRVLGSPNHFVAFPDPERLLRTSMSSVLIVDDEDAIRQLIRDALGQAGYHVSEARDGKEGLLRYRQSPADLGDYGHSDARPGRPGEYHDPPS